MTFDHLRKRPVLSLWLCLGAVIVAQVALIQLIPLVGGSRYEGVESLLDTVATVAYVAVALEFLLVCLVTFLVWADRKGAEHDNTAPPA